MTSLFTSQYKTSPGLSKCCPTQITFWLVKGNGESPPGLLGTLGYKPIISEPSELEVMEEDIASQADVSLVPPALDTKIKNEFARILRNNFNV